MKTIFYGGNIITMEDPIYANAILIEDGKIIRIGNKEELMQVTDNCNYVDLKGSTLLPGFIDPHSHFFYAAASFLQVSVNGTQSFTEIKNIVQHFINDNAIPAGEWVQVRNYDPVNMSDKTKPTLEELDSISPDNPLIIYHTSGHMGFINSLGLKELNINDDTPSSEGGLIEKKNGKLTGYIEENDFFASQQKIPLPSLETLLSSAKKAQDMYASYGITTVQDGLTISQMIPFYETIINKHYLDLDIILYTDIYSNKDIKNMLSKYPDNHNIRYGGLKILLDGSPQARTAWMRQPYQNEKEYRGYGTMSDYEVIKAFTLAAQQKDQLLAHCNGDGATEQFLNCLNKVESEYHELKKLRPVIIHGQLIGRDQLETVKRTGALISFFVAHILHWGDIHIKNFGIDRANYISPVRSAIDHGIKYTFHQDTPVINPDMIETLHCSVNRITSDGIQLSEDEKVSVIDALKGITINGAYQYFMENEKGSLSIGKDADFVILDKNPLETPTSEIKEIKVLETYKYGKSIYKKDK